MTYTVAKQNLGSPRTYTSPERFIRAIERAGGDDVRLSPTEVVVTWPGGAPVTYPIDKDGNVDPQLAWDMEP